MSSFNAAILQAIEKYSSRPALMSQEGQIISFEIFGQTISALASHLSANGVVAGQRILPIVDNRALRIFLRFALLRLGVVVDQSTLTLPNASICRHLDAVIAFADQEVKATKKLTFQSEWLKDLPRNKDAQVSGGKVIFASSGSTGLPKYMQSDLDILISMAQNRTHILGPGNGAILSSIPDNVRVSNIFMLRALLSGNAVMGMQGNADKTLGDAQKLGVTEMLLTPIALREMIEAIKNGATAGQIQQINVVGATADGSLLDEAQSVFDAKIMILAGALEVGFYSAGEYDAQTYEHGWSGTINPWIEAEIRGQGEYLMQGPTAGRLALRIPANLRLEGYLGDKPAYQDDGFFETGDIAKITKTRELIFCGRVDYLINLSGSKYSPELIEMLALQVPNIRQAAATAVQKIGAKQTDLGILVIANDDFDPEHLKSHLNAKLGTNTTILVQRCQSLPILPSGKLNRTKLKTLFEN